MHLRLSHLLCVYLCFFSFSLGYRLGHSHHGEGGVGHAGSHHRGRHAARLPHLQHHVHLHGGFGDLPGQVRDGGDLLKSVLISLVAAVGRRCQ